MGIGGYLESRPLIPIPQPHLEDHVGLAIFSSSSIVPMLRFYSTTYRIFMLMSIAFIFILRPIAKLIRLHGWDSPTYFRKKVGALNWQYRDLKEPWENYYDLVANILDATQKLY